MNKAMKIILKPVTLAIVLVSLSLACSGESSSQPNTKTEEVHFPNNGEKYFKSIDLESEEFIHIKFENNTVTGQLYLSDEYFGEVYYNFKGTVINDSIIEVKIRSDMDSDETDERWLFNSKKNHLKVISSDLHSDIIQFKSLNCEEMPDITEYGTAEDVASEENAEASENAPTYCFGMAYPTGNKRTSITEYIRFKDIEGQISGYGAGYTEGEPYRSFQFDATYLNDSTLRVEATYSPEGKPSFTSSEAWTVDLENGVLKLDNKVPKYMRILGDGKFHSINCEKFPKWAEDLIESHNDRTKK